MTHTDFGHTRAALFRDPDFRWIASGSIVSALGDQFTGIALPWLVLKMTGDTLALGMVLLTMNLPRVLLMMIGGASADRYSPRRVLLISQGFNAALLAILGTCAFTGNLSMWMAYALALGIGFATAFAIPSWSSLTARVLGPERLPVANSVLMSASQIAQFSGPLLAGLLIALFGDGGSGAPGNTRGIGAAFLFDAASFAFCIVTLSRVKGGNDAQAAGHSNMLKVAADGMRYFWSERSLRTFSLYAVTIAFFAIGPIQTAMPVLAQQFANSSMAYGFLSSAFGIGGVAGMFLFGLRPHFRIRNIGTTMLLVDLTIGLLLLPMAKIGAIWQGAFILLGAGMLGGFVQVMAITWMQQRVAPAMIGRAMSVFMFLMQGSLLVSVTFSGWLMRGIPASTLYFCSGIALIATVLTAMLFSSMRTITDYQSSAEPQP